MPAVYFWTKNRFLAENAGPLVDEEFRFVQNSPALALLRRERLWIFTRDCDEGGTYVLAGSVIVERTEELNTGPDRYQIVAQEGTSTRYRLIYNPPRSVEPVIRSLSIGRDFKDEITLGQYFQGNHAVRIITDDDDAALAAFAASLSPAILGNRWRLARCP